MHQADQGASVNNHSPSGEMHQADQGALQSSQVVEVGSSGDVETQQQPASQVSPCLAHTQSGTHKHTMKHTQHSETVHQ